MLAAHPGEAAAKSYRVEITSKPSGATVWIDDRAGDPVGETPYRTRLDEGTYTVFIELDGYQSVVKKIRVRRKRRGKQRVSVTLEEAESGSIDVLGPDGDDSTDGATVTIDGKEVGTVPDTFMVAEGSHEVEVTKDGVGVFKTTIEVTAGESQEIIARLEKPKPRRNKRPPRDTSGGGEIEKPRPPKPASDMPLVSLGAGLGSGYRKLAYQNPAAGTENILRGFDGPFGLVNVTAQLHLGGVLSGSWARSLSIFGAGMLSFPAYASTADGDESITTLWIAREVGLRGEFPLGPLWLTADIAEHGTSFSFLDAGELEATLPAASYEALRLGGGVSARFGDSAAGVGGDGLIVFGTGGLGTRFGDDSVVGFRLHGWFRYAISSKLAATATANLTQFSHTLIPMGEFDADGAVDRTLAGFVNLAYAL